MINLDDLVKDWNGFEKFVADLHKTGAVKVEHNVKLVGNSGAERQIDVLITHENPPYSNKIACECKYWTENVTRLHIDAMIAGLQDLPEVSQGAFFTKKGYQKGAVQAAKNQGIKLFNVEELKDEDWGLPGRNIKIYFQFITKGIKNLKLPIEWGITNSIYSSQKNYVKDDKGKDVAIQDLLELICTDVIKKIYMKNPVLINKGENCTRYLQYNVDYKKLIFFDACLKVDQWSFEYDRGKDLLYAFLLKEQNKDFIVYKKNDGSESVTRRKRNNSTKKANKDDVLKNRSIGCVLMKGGFDANEMKKLTPIEIFEGKKRYKLNIKTHRQCSVAPHATKGELGNPHKGGGYFDTGKRR